MAQHYFNTMVAKEVGLNAAVIFENLSYWIKQNAKNGRNFKDNKYWTYTTQSDLASQFDYLSVKQVRTAIGKLTEHGYIEVGIYNKMKIDKTHWYTLTEKGASVSNEGESERPKGQSLKTQKAIGFDVSGSAIPISKTDNKKIYRLNNIDPDRIDYIRKICGIS